jgi:hypothetical protein
MMSVRISAVNIYSFITLIQEALSPSYESDDAFWNPLWDQMLPIYLYQNYIYITLCTIYIILLC